MAQIDIIIISFAKNAELRETTEKCVKSIIDSEDNISFNIFIIESNRSEQFKNLASIKNVKVIHPNSQFGYNKYLNVGLRLSSCEYVCLCNNDLIFSKGWATNLIKAMQKDPDLLSASPYSTNPHKTRFGLNIEDKIEYGYKIRRYLTGWCIFQKRKIYNRIGLFDERFTFWYADNDYAEVLKQKNVKHALVLNSVVEHMESKTLKTENLHTRKKLTIEQEKIFKLKWGNE